MIEPLLAGDMERQYLILPRTQEGTAGYEQKMVMHNKIKGLLSVEMRTIDQEEQYYYDVTGKKSLGEFLTQKKLMAGDIAFIYGNIIDEIMNAKQYLLQEDNFVISKDTVYLDNQETNLFLCYKEDFHTGIQKQLVELTEYFMNQIDYHDEKAVLYIYGIYKLIRQDNCTFTDVKGILEKYGQTNIEQPEEKDEQIKIMSERIKTETVLDEPTFPQLKEPELANTQQKSSIKASFEKIIIIVANIVICLLLYKIDWFTENVNGTLNLKKCILTGSILLVLDSFLFEKMKKKQIEVPLILDEEDEDGSTILLCNDQTQYELISEEGVSCLEFSQQDLPIMIGKSRECGKGYLPDKIISRHHAKFRWEAGRFQIADIGSTNGTFLNGEELKSRQFYEVQDKDRITFGNMTFVIRMKGV